MARKRQRKKKQQTESLQVDLLDEGKSTPEPEVVEEPAPEVAKSSKEERDAGESQDSGDRWAKAVGQLKPSRERRDAPVPADGDEEAPPADEPEPVAEGAEGTADEGSPTPRAKTGRASTVAPSPDDQTAPAVRPAGEALARARDLVSQGRVHEAIELYLEILSANPSSLKAHNNLGVLLDELKQFETALGHFEAAERLAPENVEVLANYASTLTSLARYEEAEELLRRAQRLDAEDVRARLGIGILYFRRGLYAQAEAELRWVLARDDDNGSGHYYRGEALNRLGRFDEAAEELKRAVQLIPDDPRPYYTLGHLHDRRHELEEAAEMYRHARRLQAR